MHVTPHKINYWWWAIGTLVASLSLISLIQKVGGIDLAPIPQAIVDYVQVAFGPLRTFFVSVMPFRLPDWYTETYTLSFICSTALARSILPFHRSEHSRLSFMVESAGMVVMSALLAVVFLGFVQFLIVVVTSLASKGSQADEDEDDWVAYARAHSPPSTPEEAFQLYLASLAIMVVVALTFFAWNSLVK
jgi:hypothetical protein